MPNIAKKIVKKSRDRLLNEVTHSLERLNSEVEELQHAQVQAGNRQEELHVQLSDQIRNTGIIHIANNEILVKIFNGLKIYLDTRDIAVVPHLALDGIWEPQITNAWLSMVGPEDTILDVGANFGYFGLLAAQKTNKKKSKVIFIEANPHLIPYINKTLSLNWYNEQSVVENFAVSDTEGTVTLNVLKDYIGSSSIQTVEKLDSYMHDKMHLELSEAISVQSVTIDSYCKKQKIKEINLIKMDIEGYEDKAYAGMREIIKASPNVTLFVEFTRDGYDNPKTFYEQMLADFGYVYLIDKQGNLVRPKATSYEHIIGDADDWVMPVFSKNENLANRT
ncbi:MAG TPA: FkbM family methyltransferase [Candidatus Saccharimonadales bacterium]|jgi:FkbM family methyltransferase|nr:FkbM family methyltransferase [Candidatus Saccharimonadales bacterium]